MKRAVETTEDFKLRIAAIVHGKLVLRSFPHLDKKISRTSGATVTLAHVRAYAWKSRTSLSLYIEIPLRFPKAPPLSDSQNAQLSESFDPI